MQGPMCPGTLFYTVLNLCFFSSLNMFVCFSPPAHHTTAIFELVRPFDHRMMPGKFRDHVSNGSGVIVLTDKQTNRHY